MSEQDSRTIPKPSDFFLNIPLYKHYEYEEEDYRELLDIKNYEGPLDCHCMWCESESVFKTRQSYKGYEKDYALSNGVFSISLTCSRITTHEIKFYFLILGRTIQKIGQFPSLADIEKVEINKYRGVLDEELYNEFSKAIGLSAHGVGIGSFVYLRRIFEKLVFASFEQSEIDGIDADAFKKLRMDEKIDLLNDRLPSFLVENSHIYSILSKGLHSLTEQDTLEAFPAVKLGIELILDEKLEQDEKRKKIKRAEKEIGEVNKKFKNA